MKIPLVNQRNVDRRTLQFQSCVQASKAASEDYDAVPVWHVQRSRVGIHFALQNILTLMISPLFLMRWRPLPVLCFSAVLLLPAAGRANSKTISSAEAAVDNQATPPAIIVGFVGGLVRHDDAVHSEVQIAADLRKKYPEGVHVETFENRRMPEARKMILSILDIDHDGKLSDFEKRSARIILYGHSWGAAAVVTLARDLQKVGVPVLLTVQVDSVAKSGQNDALIPENVAEAVNFYQPDGWLRGQPQIHAADPAHTKILGNFRSDYKAVPYTCQGYPWFGRIFSPEHIKIECDISLWNKIEDLIREQLPAAQLAKIE